MCNLVFLQTPPQQRKNEHVPFSRGSFQQENHFPTITFQGFLLFIFGEISTLPFVYPLNHGVVDHFARRRFQPKNPRATLNVCWRWRSGTPAWRSNTARRNPVVEGLHQAQQVSNERWKGVLQAAEVVVLDNKNDCHRHLNQFFWMWWHSFLVG